jgi:hypothetical protein
MVGCLWLSLQGSGHHSSTLFANVKLLAPSWKKLVVQRLNSSYDMVPGGVMTDIHPEFPKESQRGFKTNK